MSYKCGHCGSEDVQVKGIAWVNPNSGTDPATMDLSDIPDTLELSMNPSDEYCCWPCGKTYLIKDLLVEEDEPRRLPSDREDWHADDGIRND